MLEGVFYDLLLLVAPLLLLGAAWIWTIRASSGVGFARRVAFVVGLTASTGAYVANFILDWYLRRAHLGYWQEAHVAIRVGNVMCP